MDAELAPALSCIELRSLREAFCIERGNVISLVGGGGKTTLMYALAREMAAPGGLVVTTTTTKILAPLSSQTDALRIESDEEEMITWLLTNAGKYRHVTVAREKLASGKLAGISPELASRIARLRQVSRVIVEADGAAHRSLKAPNDTEPVIPSDTSLVIPVVGIDALGCRLTPEHVFRPEIVSALLGLPLGTVMSAESVATLVTHERGIAKGSPAQARIVPFINKVDIDAGLSKGKELAARILAHRHPQINQVVMGTAANAGALVLSCRRSPEPSRTG